MASNRQDVVVGSRWKYIHSQRVNPNYQSNNPTIFVSRITTRWIRCGPYLGNIDYEYGPGEFKRTLVRLDDPNAELFAQIKTLLVQLSSKKIHVEALHEELVNFEI